MERGAFKIPLRPNPSTLPNVLPTMLYEPEAGLQNKQKSFSFIPFQESESDLINTHHVPRDGWELLLSGCGQKQWFSSLLTQLMDQRLGLSLQTGNFAVTAPSQPNPSSVGQGFKTWKFVLMYFSVVLRTYADRHCLVFYPQCECSCDYLHLGCKSK